MTDIKRPMSYSGSETPSSLVASFLKNWGLKYLLVALIDNLKNNNPTNETYQNNLIIGLTKVLEEYESRYNKVNKNDLA